MAEEASEDISIENEGQDKILGLPKKIFIIVVAVVVTLIIAASVYFFLAGKEETNDNSEQNGQNQATPTADKLINPPGNNAQPSAENDQAKEIDDMRIQVFELREQVIQLKEENLILKKQIYDLETAKPQTGNNNNQARPARNPYDSKIKDFPPIEPYVPVDKPKPKFGD